ncbi:unnamed protein product [Rotaria sp. Silwood1]|nr:unnamed protein product [Rotaria sp. Silwood1]
MATCRYARHKDSQDVFCLDGFIEPDDEPEDNQSIHYFFNIAYLNDSQLPPKVDLRPLMTPVENQAKLPSCVPNACAAYEYLYKRNTGNNFDVSRLFIFYNARKEKQGSDGKLEVAGVRIPYAIEALKKFGTCDESLWPYDSKKVNKRPPDEAFEAAKNYTILDELKVNVDLTEMKKCLAEGHPFIFGIRTFQLDKRAKKNGIVPMPKPGDVSSGMHSRHAMLAVGYSDRSQAFIVRNSWGENWGDKGYCYIPYDYMTDPNLCRDVWIIRQVDNESFGDEYWDNDDLTNHYEHNDDDVEFDEDDIELIELELELEEEEEEKEEKYVKRINNNTSSVTSH